MHCNLFCLHKTRNFLSQLLDDAETKRQLGNCKIQKQRLLRGKILLLKFSVKTISCQLYVYGFKLEASFTRIVGSWINSLSLYVHLFVVLNSYKVMADSSLLLLHEHMQRLCEFFTGKMSINNVYSLQQYKLFYEHSW